uniref:Uncharacterized protein n=1 Tax=Rhizophora mucronata TaxID=61149 RepID=A0A2P2NNF1_RHIMU
MKLSLSHKKTVATEIIISSFFFCHPYI